ncbi:MAG: HepT-like ribonuclease domain-containing protein [Prosthecobacter sp.]|nr:HepT-like ribonuclease domain-containing protein [Prosthecobacter sp.]
MSKHDPRVTLQQLRDIAREAADICQGLTLEQLQADRIRTLALERCFEIVGEAIKRLPDDLRDRYAQHDWRGAAGMRDRIAHGYEWVDHEMLWKAVHERFPGLFATIDQMLTDLGGELPTEEQPPRT